MLITFEYSKFYCLKLHPVAPFFLLAKNMIKTRHTIIHKPMSISCSLICFSFLLSILIKLAHSATFEIENQCSHTVWAAAVPGGGKQLNSSQSWKINVKPGTTQARIWGRTNCTFNATGHGHCETGDCNGLLQCQSYGQPPNTLAEYALNLDGDIDYLDISLVDGFNIPMNLTPITDRCNGTTCSADINGQCPTELQAPGGCNNPCAVFKTDQYCCDSGTCEATNFSRFFKDRCPNAYSYLMDDPTSTFSCPSGTNYKVVFCPKMNGTKEDNSSSTDGTTFEVQNYCSYTVWAAAVPGGGKRLDQGQSWTIKQDSNRVRIWARTGCNFDANSRGTCQTGDCGGVLQCTGFGKPPNTLAEFSLNQINNRDFMDISLVDGFNVPMGFSSVSGCTRNIRCTANIVGQCPNELKAPGGCNNPCTVFKTQEYCCTQGPCGPTDFSRFFKQRCPDAYSYPLDDATATFTCPPGTGYGVIFCP